MKAQVGRISVVAALILAPASALVAINSARGEDACLTAPNGPAPQGSHWYFHEDRATQQKCWTIKPVNHTSSEAVAPDKTAAEKPETDAVTAAPSGAHADPVRNNTQANPRRPAKASAARTDAPPAGSPKVAARPEASPSAPAVAAPWPEPPAAAKPSGDAAAWPNPQAKTAADPVAWPDPSAAAVAKESIAWPDLPAAQAGGAGVDADKATEPSAPVAAAPTSGDANAQPTGASAAAASSDLPVGLLLGGAVVLVIVGLYLRAIVTRSIKRPRTANVRRREPARIEHDADERRMPAFPEHLFQLAANQNEQLRQDLRQNDEQRQNDEAVAALRKLLLILDRQAA
jgi:hypothetical protein